MRKSWLDGLGPRRNIPGRKQGEGCARNDGYSFQLNTGMCRVGRRAEAEAKTAAAGTPAWSLGLLKARGL